MNPTTRALRLALAAALTTFSLAAASPARAADFYADGSLAGGASSWRGDPMIAGTLHVGVEWLDVVSVEGVGRLGYGAVDDRLLELLGLGTRLRVPIAPVTPYVRIAAIHQHESPLDAFHHDTFGHLFGVGDGIRHRFGFEGALGATWTFVTFERVGLSAQIEGFVDAFPDDRGPTVYAGGGLGFGVEVGL